MAQRSCLRSLHWRLLESVARPSEFGKTIDSPPDRPRPANVDTNRHKPHRDREHQAISLIEMHQTGADHDVACLPAAIP
jgi:hypothetical protein